MLKKIESSTNAVARTAESWALIINKEITVGVAQFIKVGTALLAAKAELGHGRFTAMFKLNQLRINLRTAQVLMRLAKNQTLSNANNYSHLPSALKSLETLASLDEAEVQTGINAGKLTATSTIANVKIFALEIKPTKNPPASKPEKSQAIESFDVELSSAKISKVIDGELKKCPENKYKVLANLVLSAFESFSASN